MSARLNVSLSSAALADIRRHCLGISTAEAHRRAGRWLVAFLEDQCGALNPKTRAAPRDAALDAAFPSALNSGFLRIYDSTQPTDADTALGAQVLLAELTLNATAFAASSSQSKAANAITADSSANATGTATWGTIVTSGGTRYMDFSAGTATVNLVLNTASIVAAANVSVSAFTITQAA